ncbi:MAG TPA: hypothetical protein VFV78_05830 [Vicinamibacterales bacterium]|nr:hypothetical protein [Vicinamibacterales bacterium]
MPDVLIAATVLSLLFAVLMTVIAAKLLRESRTRTSSRIEALQALAAEPAAAVERSALTAPVPYPVPRRSAPPPPREIEQDEFETSWDLALRDEPTLPVGTMMPRSQPVADLAPARASAEAGDLALGNLDLGDAAAVDVPVFDRPANNHLWKTGTSPISAGPVSDHDLFEAAIPPTPSRRWTWVAAVAVIMALGGGTFYLISSGVITRAIARHDANVTAAAALPIELLSLRYATDGGNFVVTGLVQNPTTSVSLRGVQAVVYLFDAEGKFINSSRASIDTGVLSPGGESSFVVRVPASATVTKYRVSFQHDDGAAVQHVDRRGALPENTTGDAVQPAPASTQVVTARKNG